jgi:ABC-type phosphate transport system ATPase subunit
MNDLVEGCKIMGEVLLDGENIYGDMGRQPAPQTRRHGVSETEPGSR